MMRRARALVSGGLGLLCMVAAGVSPERVRAQASNAMAGTYRSTGMLDAESKLRIKVWLTASDSTIERALTELMARTTPLTHLKLQAQASVQQIPISCYVAGMPLRDVLDGLTAFSALQWRRTGEAGLLLAISALDPTSQFRQPRTAYYGMRVVHEVEKHPAELREQLKQGLVRLSSLPPEVQRAVQALLKVRADEPRGRNRTQLELPVDPNNTDVTLESESYGGETQYRLRIAGDQPVDDRSYSFNVRVFFSADQAAEYRPDPRIDTDMSDQGAAIRKDPRFALPVTLNLHEATLSETLKTLFAATHVSLLAAGTEHPLRADVVCKQLSLSEALDRICAAYGYRWDRRDSGIVTLLVNRQ